jgi:hypothetical protein
MTTYNVLSWFVPILTFHFLCILRKELRPWHLSATNRFLFNANKRQTLKVWPLTCICSSFTFSGICNKTSFKTNANLYMRIVSFGGAIYITGIECGYKRCEYLVPRGKMQSEEKVENITTMLLEFKIRSLTFDTNRMTVYGSYRISIINKKYIRPSVPTQ